jgi:hypothetical protein
LASSSVNENWTAAALIHSVYPGDKRGSLRAEVIGRSSDTDRVGFAGDTGVSDINIVISRVEVRPGTSTHSDIIAAGAVVIERPKTDSRVVLAGCVPDERSMTDGCVGAAGCVEQKRLPTNACVFAAVAADLAAHKCIFVGIADSRTLRMRHRRKRKTGECGRRKRAEE